MQRVVLSAVASLLVASSTLAASALKTQQDRLSYSMGATTGMAFKTHAIPVKPDLFAQGLQDSMNGKKLLLSKAQIKATLSAFQKEKINEMREQYKTLAAENAQKSEAFLTKNKAKPGIQTLPSGLQYKVMKAGQGQSPSVKDTVVVNYEGRLISGKVFDSSYKRGKPATFPLNAMIEGWQQALTKMKPGATWQLYIPAKLAYGENGIPGLIGPNEALIFKVNLIQVKK